MTVTSWHEIDNLDIVESPALLVRPSSVRRNIDRMIRSAGAHYLRRLRPHVKTHKMPAVTQMALDQGVRNFKAATLSEVEMVIDAARKSKTGNVDILLAHQVVGKKIDRLQRLAIEHAGVQLSTLVDSLDSLKQIQSRYEPEFGLWVDVNCGMHRTGITLGAECERLHDHLSATGRFRGLHVYDGHIHDSEAATRLRRVNSILQAVTDFDRRKPSPEIIVGGSPTFDQWAAKSDWQLSPGTTFLWDAGYQKQFSEMGYEIAAALVTQVISKPEADLICLDLGHKAIAAESPLENRVEFPTIPDAIVVGQSEEHLVIRSHQANGMRIGQPVIALPTHICPTVALHRSAYVVENDRITDTQWQVTARDR